MKQSARKREVLANLSMPSRSHHTIIKNKPHSTQFRRYGLQAGSACQWCPKTGHSRCSTRKTRSQVFTRALNTSAYP